jgi:hypothetical protein
MAHCNARQFGMATTNNGAEAGWLTGGLSTSSLINV